MGYLAAIVFYSSLLIACAGVALKLVRLAMIPQRLNVVLTPAPATTLGVIGRVARQMFLFESLYRADRLAWLLGMVFHYALLLLVVRHLWVFERAASTVSASLLVHGPLLSALCAAALVSLLVRRLVCERVRYISSPTDFIWPLWILGIIVSGYWLGNVDVALLGPQLEFTRSLFADAPAGARVPPGVVFWLHFALGCLLLVAFPFSKLMHGPNLVLMPSLVQRVRR
jgi:nitrate reductase gamma subunit